MNKVFVVTEDRSLVPFESATEQQLKVCDRLVVDRHGRTVNVVTLASFQQAVRDLERRREQILARWG